MSNATVNRFFALHYLLPFVLAALAVVHMITLHTHGSGNPLGVSANADRLAMAPYFIFKDFQRSLTYPTPLAVAVISPELWLV